MRDSPGVIGGAQEYIGTGAKELGTGVYGYRKLDISGQVATGTCEGRETLGRNGTGAYGELAASGRVEGGEDYIRGGSGHKGKSARGGGRDEGRADVPIWGGNSQIEGGDLQKDSPRMSTSSLQMNLAYFPAPAPSFSIIYLTYSFLVPCRRTEPKLKTDPWLTRR